MVHNSSRITIHDVARAARVSSSTVSRAYTTPEIVNGSTLSRVLEAARRLGYEPNRAARALATGRTGNIGVVVPDLTNPFFPAILKGAQARARQMGWSVFLADTEEDPESEYELVLGLAKQVDGVVLCSSRMAAHHIRSLWGSTRVVFLNREVAGAPAVIMDAAGGAQQAADHLIALGHRRIAYLRGPSASWSDRERRRSLRASIRRARVEIVEFGPLAPSFEAGIQGADLALASGASAIVAFNDLMALGVLSRLHDRKVVVPDDVSVVGFDDIAMAVMTTPSLTSVSVPKEEAGRSAIDLLLATLLDEPAANKRLPGQLIVRGSTGSHDSSENQVSRR
jgi:DNA-binding LacI/PurR family transcriptional regulator